MRYQLCHRDHVKNFYQTLSNYAITLLSQRLQTYVFGAWSVTIPNV